MKQFFTLICVLLLIGCSSELNKPITEELSVKELRKQIKRDSLFESTYTLFRQVGDWLLTDNFMCAKYGTTSYKQVIAYGDYASEIKDNLKEEYAQTYPYFNNLLSKADSLISFYRSIQPDSLVVLSFREKNNEETYLGRVPMFHLTVTPLKEGVEQFKFEYAFVLKMNSSTNIDNIPYSEIRFAYLDVPISDETTFAYSGKKTNDKFVNISSEEMLRDYKFIYKITDVRYQGKNWSDLPYGVRTSIINNEQPYEHDIEEMIQKEFNPDYISFTTYWADKSSTLLAENYPEIYSMLEEYSSFLYQDILKQEQ